MPIYLLDDSLSVDIYHECSDEGFEDNICISFWESCPDEERVFIHDETNIYLTVEQARALAEVLMEAARQAEANCK
jgi:hypothetical protein